MSLPEPSRRLPAAAKTAWRLSAAGQALALVVVVVLLSGVWSELGVPLLAPLLGAAALGVLLVAVVPEVRWRRWRYEVREEEIDLRHGTWTVQRTLVPIRRVQHVDTASGPLESALDLASVSFQTAAGATTIPALTRGEAEEVRRRVGELARVRDDV